MAYLALSLGASALICLSICKYRFQYYYYFFFYEHKTGSINCKEYSTHPRHFDRRAIETGTCLQKCRRTMQSVEHNLLTELHECVETKIWSQYELNSSINVLNCITAEELNDTSETSGKLNKI